MQALLWRSHLVVPCGTTGTLADVLRIFYHTTFVFGDRGSFPLGLLGPISPLRRRWGSGCAPWVLARALGSVLMLLVTCYCGHFLICCSEASERFK